MLDRPSRRQAFPLFAGLARFMAGGAGFLARASDAKGAAPFRRGINAWPWFSLTREYPAPRRDYAWPPLQEQRAIPTADDLKRLVASGFDFIRLPVDPGPLLAADPLHRRILLETIIDAVRSIRAAGLGVMVNLQTNDATHYWNSGNLISSVDAPEYKAYRALLTSIATALAALDPSGEGLTPLALEPVNEPPQSCASSAWADVQRSLLTAARQAAPHLPLVATGACGSMVSGLAALDPEPLAHLAPLLYTFHFYEPYLFSHQGAPWMREPVYRALNDVPWPGSAGSLDETLAAVRTRMASDLERTPLAKQDAYAITRRLMATYFEANPDHRFIDGYLDVIAAWSDQHAIGRDRIVMGEFGAVKTSWRFPAARDADRIRYIADVRRAAEARGFGWSFWNLFDSMGLLDDETHAFDADVIRALGMRMPAG